MKLSICRDGNRLVITIDNPDDKTIERVKRLFEQEVFEISSLENPPSTIKETEIKTVKPINLEAVAKSGKYSGKTFGWIYDNQFDYIILNIIHKPELLDQFLVTKDDFISKVVGRAKNKLDAVCKMLRGAAIPIDDEIAKKGANDISQLNTSEKEEMLLFIERFLKERKYKLDGTME